MTVEFLRHWTSFLSEKARVMSEKHKVSCHQCADKQFIDIFEAVAHHVKELRSSAEGMGHSETSDFIATHLHASCLRTMTAFEEKYNEMVELTSMVVVVMTSEQKEEFERLKSFAGKIN
jgi:hypothetical protein